MSWRNAIKKRKELGTHEHGVQQEDDTFRCELCGYTSNDQEDFANHDCTPDMLREMQFQLDNR